MQEEQEDQADELQVPEPNAEHMHMLTQEMGIRSNIASKALILHRNNLNVHLCRLSQLRSPA